VTFATSIKSIDENPPPVKCDTCGQTMRPSYCEALESNQQLNVYECPGCRTTTTVVMSLSGWRR
jgi:Zn finger protein HypA/HybF involved in hydrogenase expression